MYFRSCILYYINFNTSFACRYPCASWKLCFCPKMTYTWPPPEIDGEARFDRMIFTRAYSTTLRVEIILSKRASPSIRSEEHTSELQSLTNLVCRLLLEKKINSG